MTKENNMNTKHKSYITLTFILTYIILIGLTMFNIISSYKIFWSKTYMYLVYLGLIFITLELFLKTRKLNKYSTILSYIIFLPLAVMPLFKCWFKVPYIFCDSCPHKCPWGHMRSIFIPIFLGINLQKRFWCFKQCPFGKIQTKQLGVCKKRINLPKWVKNIRYLFLAYTIFIIIATLTNINSVGNQFIFAKQYMFILGTAIASFTIFTLSFFIPKFWCNYFCPIGSIGDLTLKLKKWVKYVLATLILIFLIVSITGINYPDVEHIINKESESHKESDIKGWMSLEEVATSSGININHFIEDFNLPFGFNTNIPIKEIKNTYNIELHTEEIREYVSNFKHDTHCQNNNKEIFNINSNQEEKVDCPFGIEEDPSPGRCRLYIDKNNNGICDLSE